MDMKGGHWRKHIKAAEPEVNLAALITEPKKDVAESDGGGTHVRGIGGAGKMELYKYR